MTHEEAINRLEAGAELVDIGQISRATRASIRRYVRWGVLVAYPVHYYPQPKTAYRRARLAEPSGN